MSIVTEILNNVHPNNIVDLSEIITCRLCGETNVKVKYIFLKNNIELQKKIHDVLHIGVDFSDPINKFFPKQICESCSDRIDAFEKFKLQCKHFHSQWMSQIHGRNNRLKENETTSIANDDEVLDSQLTKIEENIPGQGSKSTYQVHANDVFFGEIEWIYEDEVDTIEERSGDLEESMIIHDNVNVDEKFDDNSSSTRINRYGFSYETTAFNYIRKTDDDEFACKLCESKFKWSYQCEIHVRYHTKETPFICQHCNKGFITKHYLNSHEKDVHRTSEFICKTCGRQFTRKYLLTEHEMEHSGSPKIQCPQCNLKFYGTTKLTAHIRNYHSSRNCTCDICGKTFKTKVRLSEHRIRHSGDKNFICNHCDKGFVTKRELTVHLKREKHLNNSQNI